MFMSLMTFALDDEKGLHVSQEGTSNTVWVKGHTRRLSDVKTVT